MRKAICVNLSRIIVIAMLALAAPATAQLTVQWERLIGGDQGIKTWDITQLENQHYLVSYLAGVYPDYDAFISEIGVNGALLHTIPEPPMVNAYYLEEIVSNQILALYRSGVSDSSGFCLLSYPGIIVFTSQLVAGGIGVVHPYSLGGYIASSDYGANGTVMSRFDSNGAVIWSDERSIGQSTSTNDVCSSVSGNIFMPVSGYPNMFLLKYNLNGNLLNEYNYTDYRGTRNIDLLPDGNMFLSVSSSDDYPDLYLAGIIINQDAELVHEYIIPEIEDEWDANIWLMPDGGYLTTTVRMDEYPDHTSILLDRYDANFSHLWQYDYDNHQQEYYYIYDYDVLIDSHGDIVLFGQADDVGYDEPEFVFLSKFTPDPTDLEITVDGYGDVSAVPAPGRFFWHGMLTNNTDADIVTDVWVIVRGPDGYPSEPLRVWQDITVPANGVYEADLRQNVPTDAASGEYNYILRAGTYDPDNPQHTIQAYFPLTVTGGPEVNLDPPRVRGVVAAPFDGPIVTAQVE